MRVGVVSTYPPRDSKHIAGGAVSSYTKNLVSNLSADEITVYAEKTGGTSGGGYKEGNVTVKGVWRKGALFPFPILAAVSKDRPDVVHVQHEFFLYGGGASSLSFLLLLAGLKVMGIPSVVTVHGIVPLSSVDRKFVRENRSSLPPFAVRAAFSFIIRWISRLAGSLVFHEDKFVRVLKDDYGRSGARCAVIPHGIEAKDDAVEQQGAREALGFVNKRVVLFFGYITAYKGLELLIDAMGLLGPEYLLVIAGGRHPRLKDYMDGLVARAEKVKGASILFTDFVPEDKIPHYFSAADLVVYPYTIGMASSGSMSFAIAYRRPFVVSDAFSDLVDTTDAVFERTPESLGARIEGFFNDPSFRQRLQALSTRLSKERSWETVGEKTTGLYRDLLMEEGGHKGRARDRQAPQGTGERPE